MSAEQRKLDALAVFMSDHGVAQAASVEVYTSLAAAGHQALAEQVAAGALDTVHREAAARLWDAVHAIEREPGQ